MNKPPPTPRRNRLTKTPRKRKLEATSKSAESTPVSEAAPVEPPPVEPFVRTPTGKLGVMVALLSRPEGAELATLMDATGWQAHSVRGAMSGALKRRFGLTITSAKPDTVRIYHIAPEAGR